MSQIVVAFLGYLNFNKTKISNLKVRIWSKTILVHIYDTNLIFEIRSNLNIAVTLDADETHQTLGSRVRWLGR